MRTKTPPRFLFVGERPSGLALRLGATWQSGGLAAKQLHDGLRAVGIDPLAQRYCNVFRPDPDGPEVVNPAAVGAVRRQSRAGLTVVAMGRKVARVLAGRGLVVVEITHPAARGRIRLKAAYAAHLRQRLEDRP